MSKGRISYTFEECKKKAFNFNDRTSFKVQSNSIYSYAYKRGWLNDICSHMPVKKKTNGFWTKEKCLEEAKKYQTRTEFSDNSPSGYSIAKRNGWLEECCEHMIVVGSKVKRAIYVFEFSDKYAYVGLSYNLEVRKNQHLTSTNSPVYKHLQQTLSSYMFKRLTEYIDLEEAVQQEAHYIEKYYKNGWILLNSRNAGATGGSILIWDFNKCLEEALEYEARKDFKENSSSAYGSALRNNWLDEICIHMDRLQNPKNFWDEGKCEQEALKFKSRTEFHRKSGSAYSAASKLGILDRLCSHMNKKEPWRIWTKEKCKIEALKYRAKSDFKKGSSAAHSAAVKGGFLDDICSHMTKLRKPKGFWNFEKCKKEAAKFASRSEFQKKDVSAYREALNNGWLDEICTHMKSKIKPKNHWTKERCHEQALKYDTRSEFQKNSNAAYCKSAREKWLDEICSHMVEIKKPNNFWTKEKCAEISIQFTIKSEFRKNHPNIYAQAHRKGFLDEICSHMKPERRPANDWTKENIIKEMEKYKTRTEFNKNSGGAAVVARGYGWYDELWRRTHPED
ncbi:GIY-YIG nuclease family protein [Desulfonatronovibrio magnus]|uniref:GIY-YIG nuclease family protein n=1 Tax=Desulfonatronovibrio magnus TaxID=698827 RepID=UPI0005EACC7B|nr:GIY-YIG nuclease family protein [Desulfonatronovibrio magnus]